MSDINEKVTQKFVEKANSVGRLEFKYESKEITLQKLKESGKITFSGSSKTGGYYIKTG